MRSARQIISEDKREIGKEMGMGVLILVTAPIWLPLWPVAEVVNVLLKRWLCRRQA